MRNRDWGRKLWKNCDYGDHSDDDKDDNGDNCDISNQFQHDSHNNGGGIRDNCHVFSANAF